MLTYEEVVIARQADRNDVVSEGDPPLRPHQRQVVLVGEEVVLGVDDLPGRLQLQVLVRLAGEKVGE